MWKLYLRRKEDGRLTVEFVAPENASGVEQSEGFVQWLNQEDAPDLVRMPECQVAQYIELHKQFWQQYHN